MTGYLRFTINSIVENVMKLNLNLKIEIKTAKPNRKSKSKRYQTTQKKEDKGGKATSRCSFAEQTN
jgi:hypothetical protein